MCSELVFYDHSGKPVYVEDCNTLTEIRDFNSTKGSDETKELDPEFDLK